MKSQDVLVAVRLACLNELTWSYATVAADTGLSKSEVHEAIERLRKAGLVDQDKRHVQLEDLLTFLTQGLRYAFPPEETDEEVVGIPLHFDAGRFVWPVADKETRGRGLVPLHKGMVTAAQKNVRLLEALSLVEILRQPQLEWRMRAEARLVALLQPAVPETEPNQPRAPLPLETERAILEAATRLFSSRGFSGTSIKDIARLAGVNSSLIAYHFGNKANLQVKVLETLPRMTGEHLGRVLLLGDSVSEKHLLECFESFTKFLREDERFYRLSLWSRADVNQDFDGLVRESFTLMAHQLGAILQKTSGGEGEIDKLCRAFGFLLLAEQYGSLRWNYLARLNTNSEVSDALMTTFGRMLSRDLLTVLIKKPVLGSPKVT